jgi:hypothetical protein
MPLSNYAQSIMSLKSDAPLPSDDLANMIDSVKKSLNGNSTHSAMSSSATETRQYRGGGGGGARNGSGHGGNFRAFGRSNDRGSWNSFRRDGGASATSQHTDNNYTEPVVKSIPVKVENNNVEDPDGWVSVRKGRSKPLPVAKATASEPPKFRTARPQTKGTEDAILNNVILGKLNKFSQANFDDCREFLQQILDGDQKDFLRAFMKLVFEKAAMENTFCPLYAKLLGSLVDKYPVILEEMNELHLKYMEIFGNISEKSDDYDKFVEENKKKAYRLGYSQFLGELIKLDILSRDVLFGIVKNILDNISKIECEEGQGDLVEEYTDCLIKLMKAFSERGMTPLRTDLNEEFGSIIESLSKKRPETKSIPAKARFGFMDCLDILRKK